MRVVIEVDEQGGVSVGREEDMEEGANMKPAASIDEALQMARQMLQQPTKSADRASIAQEVFGEEPQMGMLARKSTGGRY